MNEQENGVLKTEEDIVIEESENTETLETITKQDNIKYPETVQLVAAQNQVTTNEKYFRIFRILTLVSEKKV